MSRYRIKIQELKEPEKNDRYPSGPEILDTIVSLDEISLPKVYAAIFFPHALEQAGPVRPDEPQT